MATQKNIIDEAFPETLKILSELIKFQTVSGTSNVKLIEYCEKKLSKLGATSFKTFDEAKQRVNLFSTISGKQKLNGGGIILSGHTDVVPASAKDWLADSGYDIHFGARPLRRVIQNNIEDNLSDSLLKGELQPGDTAVIDVEDGKILITPKSSLPIASA